MNLGSKIKEEKDCAQIMAGNLEEYIQQASLNQTRHCQKSLKIPRKSEKENAQENCQRSVWNVEE